MQVWQGNKWITYWNFIGNEKNFLSCSLRWWVQFLCGYYFLINRFM
jgi:hypothetical protein